MDEEVDVFLRESDAFSWYMERDPTLRSTIVAIAWLSASPDWDTMVKKLDRASRAIPLFRKHLIEPPARLATPRWATDPEFDLSWHLRRVESPPPHTKQTVMALARAAAMSAFDPAHPLWEFMLVERVEGHGAALIMKVHHSLTDGIGGMKLAMHLFDTTPDLTVVDDGPEAPEGEVVTPASLVRESLNHDWEKIVAVALHQASVAAPSALGAARHPLRTGRDLVATAQSIGRMVAPVTKTLSPVMTGRGLGRQLDMLTFSLPDLKRAAGSAGGTVNDGFLAGLTGGLRRYHLRHGTTVDELRITLPISIRTEDDPVAGNRITLQRFTVPVGVDDPAVRIRETDARCRTARQEPAVAHTNAVAGALNLLPPSVVGGMLKHVDFLASNVPGFTFPVYLAGAELTGYFPFGPTIGAAVNATLLTYNGTCCIGVTIDTAAVPDPETLMASFVEGFEEVLDLGGDHEPVTLPLRKRATKTLAGHGGGRHP